MALYEDYEDEETRRQGRPPDAYNKPAGSGAPGWNPSTWDDGYGDPHDGMGSPQSGYGPGGVNNPAYTGTVGNDYGGLKQTGDDVFRGNRNAAPVDPRSNNQPQTQNQPSFAPPQAAAPAPQASMKQPGITDEVTKILMARLSDLKNPGDVSSDPIYQQAVRQQQIGQLRDADRQRKALAERTAATHGTTSSGGFNVGVRAINERAGENASQYRSGLAMDRLSARESQLNEAIKMARAVGQDDIANQFELQRLQLQSELGRGDLALRGELGRGQLGLGYDNLGLSYADLIMRENRNATLAGLNGGG